MNLIKSSLYSIAWLALIGMNSANAAVNFGWEKVDSSLRGSNASADIAGQKVIGNVITFLYIVAVGYALWGGFSILTAGWDEEKVKKGKTVLTQAVLWLVVIWLAGSVIEWIVAKVLTPSAG